MSLAGFQINLIDVNFHLQKSLEIFDTNSADKIRSKKDKECKVPSLIRVKYTRFSYSLREYVQANRRLNLHAFNFWLDIHTI